VTAESSILPQAVRSVVARTPLEMMVREVIANRCGYMTLNEKRRTLYILILIGSRYMQTVHD